MVSLVDLARPRSLLDPPQPQPLPQGGAAGASCERITPVHVITGVNFSSPPSPPVAAPLDRYWPELVPPGPDVLTRDVTPAPALYSTLHVIPDRAVCDWLTLTTYNRADAVALLRFALRRLATGTASPAKIQQYAGFKLDGCFYGAALQGGRSHSMVQLHGSVAHQVLADGLLVARELLQAMKCTRIDVKLDVSWTPAQTRFAELYGWLIDPANEGAWAGLRRGGPRPSCRAFVNEDGLDTLYLGARSSARMQRVYVKQVGDERLTRWEVEFKEDLAAAVWRGVLAGGEAALRDVLAAEVGGVPLRPFLPTVYERLDAPAERLRLVADKSDAERTLKWLHEAVTPAVVRLSAAGGRPARMAGYWLDEVLDRARAKRPRTTVPLV